MADEPLNDKDMLFAQLDGLLEDEIRARLATGIWGDEKRRLVQLYLDDKALQRAKAVQAEQTEIARSAKDAAWAAVDAAKSANRRATVAIAIAIISAGAAIPAAIIAVLSLLKPVR